jgi:hypothetical protein
MIWLESSLQTLYLSAVEAFPKTTKRQYATHEIKVVNVQWIPFVGMKTLFVKGRALHEEREYSPSIVFKKVQYAEDRSPRMVVLKASDGKTYFLERLAMDDTDVLVRCSCGDFKWRFSWYNHLDHSLQGSKPKKYTPVPGSNRPPANPTESFGICKHIMKLAKVLSESTILGENYAASAR